MNINTRFLISFHIIFIKIKNHSIPIHKPRLEKKKSHYSDKKWALVVNCSNLRSSKSCDPITWVILLPKTPHILCTFAICKKLSKI